MVKRPKLEEIAQQVEIPVTLCANAASPPILGTRNSEEELPRDNQIYLDKIELARQTTTIVD